MTRPMRQLVTTLGLALVLTALIGCEDASLAPPVTIEQYRAQEHARGSFPPATVVRHNLQRVTDSRLPIEQRRASLKLVLDLEDQSPETYDILMPLLSAGQAPSELQRDLLDHLLKGNDPAMAVFVVKAMQQPQIRGAMQASMLQWLTRNADGGALAEVVKAWALEPPDGPSERHFRTVVQKVRRREWDEALVEAMNESTFKAKGSALEVLVQRVRLSDLKRKFMSLPPQTEAVAAIQTFINAFDYIPISKAALVQTVVAYKTQQHRIDTAAALANRWASYRQDPYLFNIRDFAVLAALAGDEEAIRLTQPALALRVGKAHTTRAHPIYRPDGKRSRTSTRLTSQASHLSMADFWRLWLLEEMFSRASIRTALRELAKRDRTDTRGARGGLIVYEYGRAEAKLYPPKAGSNNDRHYVAGNLMIQTGRNALCRFVTHFAKTNNADRAGPTMEELADAKAGNFCGLTITSLDDDIFCVHYYTPAGVVVSLGQYPFFGELPAPSR